MRLCDGELSRPCLWLALLALLMLCSGCQTRNTSLFAATGPGWEIREGQALWRPRGGMPELGGDVLLATHPDGRCLLEFTKGTLPMVSVQTTPAKWLIQFPARRIGFSGRGRPPARFAWLGLPAALDGETVTPPLRFERKADGGWRLENTRSGESVEGFLTP